MTMRMRSRRQKLTPRQKALQRKEAAAGEWLSVLRTGYGIRLIDRGCDGGDVLRLLASMNDRLRDAAKREADASAAFDNSFDKQRSTKKKAQIYLPNPPVGGRLGRRG